MRGFGDGKFKERISGCYKIWLKKVCKSKACVGKGCWKWDIGENGVEAWRDGLLVLSDRWKEVEVVPSSFLSFPSHTLQTQSSEPSPDPSHTSPGRRPPPPPPSWLPLLHCVLLSLLQLHPSKSVLLLPPHPVPSSPTRVPHPVPARAA